MVVQMNTRIDQATKKAGDAVFADLGYTPSAVVRVVWEYASRNRANPSAVAKMLASMAHDAGAPDPSLRADRMRASSEMVGRLMQERGLSWPEDQEPLPYSDLRDRALLERYSERGLL